MLGCRHTITLYNVCAVPWGVLSTVGVFSTVGGYHEYRGGYLEYRGGYHDKCGGYLEYRGGVQYLGWISRVPWRVILSTVGDVQYRGRISWWMWGDIMSTVGVFSTMGGYHPLKFEYRGGISWYMWGDITLCDGEWWESAHFGKTQWNSVSKRETQCGKVRQRQTNLTNSVFDSVSRFVTMFDAERQCLILRDDFWFCLLYLIVVSFLKNFFFF